MKRYILISFSITIALYLITSFIIWDITCIKYIPKLESNDRAIMVMAWIFKEIISVAVYQISKLQS